MIPRHVDMIPVQFVSVKRSLSIDSNVSFKSGVVAIETERKVKLSLRTILTTVRPHTNMLRMVPDQQKGVRARQSCNTYQLQISRRTKRKRAVKLSASGQRLGLIGV